MTRPAKTRDGEIHCTNCMKSGRSGTVQAEKVRDADDHRAYALECPGCDATGSFVVELGFSTAQEIDEPFQEGL